jgi:hypothetical protein
VATDEEVWQGAGIQDYTLEVTITGCMICGEPLKYSVTVVDGKVTGQKLPPGSKGEPLTVERLFKTIRWYERLGADVNGMVTYNEVGVPIEMKMDAPRVTDTQAHYRVTFIPA